MRATTAIRTTGRAPTLGGSRRCPSRRRKDTRSGATWPGSRSREPHLRSSAEEVGYRIRATDGDIGHVEDFIVDDQNWAIAEMVVDTRNWLPGKKVLVPPGAITGIDWENGEVSVDLKREELKRAPAAP